MSQRLRRAARVIDEAERSPERGWMSASSDLKFVIFRDVKDGYRWRLSSASGETLERSERGHDHKGECAQEVFRLKDDRYPYAKVLDATVG
jgi:uncharacterized protein YegP (UPF0339 family)